jgi:acyl-CoA thioesterase FadM
LAWSTSSAIDYRAEVLPCGLIVVRSGVRCLGGKSFATRHETPSAITGALHATCERTSVLFDLEAPRGTPILDDFRAAATKILAE